MVPPPFFRHGVGAGLLPREKPEKEGALGIRKAYGGAYVLRMEPRACP